jgi:hypothetical protein
MGSAAGPHLTLSESFDFQGTVVSGSTATITARSDGTTPVTVERVLLSGKDFSVTSSPSVPAQLPPGSELELTVMVSTSGHGPIQDTLVVTHGVPPNHHSNVTLKAFVQ